MRLTAAAAAFVLVAGACSEDPVAEYTNEMASITISMTTETLTILPRGAAPTRSQVAEITAVRSRAAEEMARLEPPSEFLPEHLALQQTLAGFAEASESFLAATEGLGPDGFLEALMGSTELDTLAGAVGNACTAWERRAAELGEQVGLGC